MGAFQECVWIGMLFLGPLRENTGGFLILVFLAFIPYFWTFFRVPIETKKAVRIVIGFALLFRVTTLLSPPYQSEDVYRYIWDARIAAMGINPYEYAPNAAELEMARDDHVYPMINSKPYITAYPPVSQVLFRISYGLFGGSVIAMKAFFGLFEFLALLIAWRILILWGKSFQPLLLMAWNPFFVFEFWHSGHSDSAMIFFMLLGIYLLTRGRRYWATMSYAAGVLAKLHPVLWFPLFLRRSGWKPMIAGIAAGFGLMLVYFDPASLLRYAKSLGLYFRLFEFNASIHYLVRFFGRWAYNESWDKLIGPYLGAVLVAAAVLIFWKFPIRDERDVLHAGFWLMTADLCLATTVHPWYLSWAAAALPIFPYAFMTYWTCACFLSYIAYSSHPVHEPVWVLLIEYLPVYALMGWEIWKRRPLLPNRIERRIP